MNYSSSSHTQTHTESSKLFQINYDVCSLNQVDLYILRSGPKRPKTIFF